ncbi:hypothetical protein ACMBCN_03015, partial [Candidatus Liberibacter asiaticus]|nr:hypothetical protein [Candidatus Liberibacter asiaticus]
IAYVSFLLSELKLVLRCCEIFNICCSCSFFFFFFFFNNSCLLTPFSSFAYSMKSAHETDFIIYRAKLEKNFRGFKKNYIKNRKLIGIIVKYI